jgi:hypothetical protein
MEFRIRMGQPEMESLWLDLSVRKQQGKLSQDEEKFFKKLVKALGFLSKSPAQQPCFTRDHPSHPEASYESLPILSGE